LFKVDKSIFEVVNFIDYYNNEFLAYLTTIIKQNSIEIKVN